MTDNNHKYKNIIFDVGDVLLQYRWKELLMNYGLSDEESEELGNCLFKNSLWKELDLASKTHAEVITEFQKLYPAYRDAIEYFLNSGNLMVVNVPNIWDKVHKLKEKGYNIYLLSNYSEMLFKIHTSDKPFMKDVDGLVVSYQVHMIKPDSRIYRLLLDKYSLNAAECIFFDDRSENVEAAIMQGMASYRVTSPKQLERMLDELLLKGHIR